MINFGYVTSSILLKFIYVMADVAAIRLLCHYFNSSINGNYYTQIFKFDDYLRFWIQE